MMVCAAKGKKWFLRRSDQLSQKADGCLSVMRLKKCSADFSKYGGHW